ncbi:MAG: DUF1700 domain-containing protein [Methanimicrococcus sp.]|nr:DUF1700 domain-containing protein [Methanimicrococcus sp.]
MNEFQLKEIEAYLKKVSDGLYQLPDSERNEILGEIRNHIHEAVDMQEPVQAVIDKLGPPQKLAQSYVNIHYINRSNMSFSGVLNNMVFFLSAGLSSLIIVPTLISFILLFLLIASASISVGILGLFTDLPSNTGIMIGSEEPLTGFTALIAGLILCVIFFLLSYLSWKLLKIYAIFISRRYQKLRMGK